MSSSPRKLPGRFQNTFQTLVILSAMVSLFGLLGWIVLGAFGVIWALLIAGFILLTTPRLSPIIVLRMYNARALSFEDAGVLYRIVAELSRRAGLTYAPRLHYVPSRSMNAFSVGSKHNSAIALSDGLVRLLSLRELAGVLAHEISHISSNDLRLHALADMMTRVTSMLSFFGQALILFYLPMIFFSDVRIPLSFILALIFAPVVSMLLQLALSRTREFDADLAAVGLTNDPRGLATALQKMENYESSIWDILVAPGRKNPHPSILRTHPHTRKRIERLMNLEQGKELEIPGFHDRIVLPERFPEVFHQAGWHWFRPRR